MSQPTAPDMQALKAFRKALREASLARREAMDPADRAVRAARICAQLQAVIADVAPRVLGFCWPFRGEVDVRELVTDWLAQDDTRRAALPVVVAPRTPMVFRRWHPDGEMLADTYGIPIPVRDDRLIPDCLILPLVAFDDAGYRLGYGAGYFDRTIAAIAAEHAAPTVIGLGYECVRVPTIHPQDHDAPLDWLITESGLFRRDGAEMSRI